MRIRVGARSSAGALSIIHSTCSKSRVKKTQGRGAHFRTDFLLLWHTIPMPCQGLMRQPARIPTPACHALCVISGHGVNVCDVNSAPRRGQARHFPSERTAWLSQAWHSGRLRTLSGEPSPWIPPRRYWTRSRRGRAAELPYSEGKRASSAPRQVAGILDPRFESSPAPHRNRVTGLLEAMLPQQSELAATGHRGAGASRALTCVGCLVQLSLAGDARPPIIQWTMRVSILVVLVMSV